MRISGRPTGGVVLFCGFGGETDGARRAGAHVRAAVNHWDLAIGVHRRNHPQTKHFCGDVFNADPKWLLDRARLGWLWLSPDCTGHSDLKNGKPRDPRIRALADVAIPWLQETRAPLLLLENTHGFTKWGPLDEDGFPIKEREGECYQRWLWQVRSLGYKTETRVLRACEFGAPTTRKRFFLLGRNDGLPIRWPEPTHGPGLLPFRTAGSIIDWSVPTPSIFDRAKPYEPPTMRRVARALNKYVLGTDHPFFAPGGDAIASMVQLSYGERKTQAPRVLDINAPLGTVVAGGNKHALVLAVIVKHYGGKVGRGASLHDPLPTVTCQDHNALAMAVAVRGGGPYPNAKRVQELLDSDEERHRFPRDLVIDGELCDIVDVLMRPLTVRERARAQGFDDDYVLDETDDGRQVNETAQARMIGNAVPPQLAEALFRANLAHEERVAA